MKKVKLLLYCTKAKPYLYDKLVIKSEQRFSVANKLLCDYFLNGKIVAECDCDKVEKWCWNGWWNCYAKNNDIDIQNIDDEDFEKSCLNYGYLYDYLFENDGFALHLSNLKIFDEPKELNEYYKDNFLQELNNTDTRVNKAPQNMCYCYDVNGNKYILISIRPEYLVKILNGEKTIELRKQIMKELKEMK